VFQEYGVDIVWCGLFLDISLGFVLGLELYGCLASQALSGTVIQTVMQDYSSVKWYAYVTPYTVEEGTCDPRGRWSEMHAPVVQPRPVHLRICPYPMQLELLVQSRVQSEGILFSSIIFFR
jgi:hypothetical protein